MQIQHANYGNTFWPQFIKKYKIACSIFCGAIISKLIFRQWLLGILFASSENLGLGRAVYFSWCLSWINKKKIGGQFLVGLKVFPGRLISSHFPRAYAWPLFLEKRITESQNHRATNSLPLFESCPWFRPRGFSSWWGQGKDSGVFLGLPSLVSHREVIFPPKDLFWMGALTK